MSRGHVVKGGSGVRFLLTMLVVAGIALCSVMASLVAPLQPNLTLASPPSVNTLPATGTSGTGATLNGEMTALGEPDFVAMSAGQGHSLGVLSDGTLWAWGRNAYGQLGLSDTTDRWRPTQVGSEANWVAVAGGVSHSLGVRSDGTLWSWGINTDGQLGLGDTTDRWSPTQVGNATEWVAVSAGYNHSLGMRSDGTLWAWGRNRAVDEYPGKGGQLGLGDLTDRHVPTQVGSEANWAAVSGGISHSLGVRSDGSLWAWGWNPHGELGLGDIGQLGRKSPTQVVGATNWVAASAGLYHSLGVCSDGTLWSWGMTSGAHLGSIWSPTRVGSDTNWVAVAGKGTFSVGLRSDGTLWSWAHVADVIPSRVGSATNWATLASGSGHVLAVRSDGTLWAWGNNAYGQLGLGDTVNAGSPIQVILSPPSCQVSFEWGPTTSYWNETAPQTMPGTGAFSADISGLTLGNTYHFRAKAVAGDGTVHGGDMTFTTTETPSVTTNDVGSITANSASLNGELTSLGMVGSVTVSFEWGASLGAYSRETSGQAMTSTGAFTASIRGLTPGTTYHFRAKGVGNGTVYGVDSTFTTTGGGTATVGSGLGLWVYPVAILGGLVVLMILVAVGARLVRRFMQ
jgi:alpha-tubulin suppressor-like RCC1 family protein